MYNMMARECAENQQHWLPLRESRPKNLGTWFLVTKKLMIYYLHYPNCKHKADPTARGDLPSE